MIIIIKVQYYLQIGVGWFKVIFQWQKEPVAPGRYQDIYTALPNLHLL